MTMRALFTSILLSICLRGFTATVVVRVGLFDLPLAEVIDLKELMDNEIFERPRFTYMGTSLFCNNSVLPVIFKPICEKADAPQIFFMLREY
ncbi:hypothetical protein chiPu_0009950 [Chiloscyllium punctatum]|uniref:Uncharacterized protein n=1 Tax=Chiloscyllium punctatum TaxID=137246 RepID=A0A401SM74_CHIPU|nr:hypothetical protein [Chiloscyllium punctatum]